MKHQVVLWAECSRCSNLDWTMCCSNLLYQDEAMFHDDSSDHSVSGQVLSEGWRRHHVLFTFQKRWEPSGLRNPQTSAQLLGMDPDPHNGGVPGGVGKAKSAKASSTVLRLSRLRQREAVTLKSPATKSTSWEFVKARTVWMSFLAMFFLLASMLLICRNSTLKKCQIDESLISQ